MSDQCVVPHDFFKPKIQKVLRGVAAAKSNLMTAADVERKHSQSKAGLTSRGGMNYNTFVAKGLLRDYEQVVNASEKKLFNTAVAYGFPNVPMLSPMPYPIARRATTCPPPHPTPMSFQSLGLGVLIAKASY